MYFFFNKMYSSSLELKNKSMYKTEIRLPSPTGEPPETAGPGEGAQRVGRGLSALIWSQVVRKGAELRVHTGWGSFVPRTRGIGRGGSWDFHVLEAPLFNSLGWGAWVPRGYDSEVRKCSPSRVIGPGLEAGETSAPGLRPERHWSGCGWNLGPSWGPSPRGWAFMGPRRSFHRQLGGWARVLRSKAERGVESDSGSGPSLGSG